MVTSLKRPKASGLAAGLKAKSAKKEEEEKVEKGSPDLLERSDEEKGADDSDGGKPEEDEKSTSKTVKPVSKGPMRPKGLGARINPTKAPSKDSEKKEPTPTKPTATAKPTPALPTLQKKDKEIPKSGSAKKTTSKEKEEKEEKEDEEEKEGKEEKEEKEDSQEKEKEGEEKVETKTKKTFKPKKVEEKEPKKEAPKEPKKKEEKELKKSGTKPTASGGRKQNKRKSPNSSLEYGSDSEIEEGFDDSKLSDNSDNEDGGTAVIIRKKIRKSVDGKEDSNKPKEMRIVLSGFEKGERSSIHEIVKEFGGKIVENVDMETTHIIAKSKRTVKMLLGAARGIWVLSPNWAYSSKEEGKWLKEDDFEVDFLPGPKSMRLRKEQGEPGLLFGMHVAIFGDTSPSPRDIEDLVLAADGEVAQYYDHCKFCIASENDEVSDDYAGLPIVTEKYLLDSLSEGKLRPMQEYRHPSWKKDSAGAGAKA